MEKLKIINQEDENLHHLFTHSEVKKAIMRVVGKPETDEDYNYIDKKVKEVWNKLPKCIINKDKHGGLHKEPIIPILEVKDILKKKQIEELVCGGIKCFEHDKKIKIKEKPSLIKRIVGQIYGYLNNY